MHSLFMLRTIALLLISCHLCKAQVISVNRLVLPEGKRHNIPFIWMQSDDSGYSALLLPVKLKGCPTIFYMQFDTGSPYSMLYINKLKSINDRYPALVQVSDTTRKLQQFRFNVGGMAVLATEIVVRQFDSAGINWSKNAVEVIGTLGTDLIDNKVIAINYPKKYIQISDDERKPAGVAWTDFMYEKRRVLLPFSVEGEEKMALFDTGASAFELLTDKATAMHLASPAAVSRSRKVKSWGRTLTATSLPATGSVTMANVQLPLRTVTYIEGVSEAQVNMMKKMGMEGMVGNGLFLQSILVIDTRKKRFYVL